MSKNTNLNLGEQNKLIFVFVSTVVYLFPACCLSYLSNSPSYINDGIYLFLMRFICGVLTVWPQGMGNHYKKKSNAIMDITLLTASS
jgi:hypothetical protein